ncbi:putative PHD finger domain protein/putative inhibitor of growth protein 3 [Blumeria hordei DH14]|uniref:Chromatin modification-related protein n=1 Tax=Blumeria graminis f. sp. hordei (strain DH14) TaxID=546991 RepID=N1JJD1_BLUG1|nr:putative PHD finger domain protein/putative inhibitor of growth protein 3 [Blumeria hordei DH14]
MEQQDAATVLDEWTNRVANLPNEIAFMYEEIEQKDRQMAECLAIINRHDNALQGWVRKNGGHVANPKEAAMNRIVIENYEKAQILQAEKISLARKCQIVVEKHTRYLDNQIKALQDRGEFPVDPELPSLLREPIISQPSRPSTTLQSQPPSAVPVQARHANQYPQSAVPAHIQIQQTSILSSVSPTSPSPTATATATASTTTTTTTTAVRQTRENSMTVANKRQRLVGQLSTHIPSGLTRQPSHGPGTPKIPTPAPATRAISTGPRSQIRPGPKKSINPTIKQSGITRKLKKSSLSRVKRTSNKNSPSSTNDSELSDADSGSVDDEDETQHPKRSHENEADEELVEMEDDDGADDRKYCTCQSVSYGDMVACDNPGCEFEWFHWSCVGLKSEPLGTWICAACKAAGFKT